MMTRAQYEQVARELVNYYKAKETAVNECITILEVSPRVEEVNKLQKMQELSKFYRNLKDNIWIGALNIMPREEIKS